MQESEPISASEVDVTGLAAARDPELPNRLRHICNSDDSDEEELGKGHDL